MSKCLVTKKLKIVRNKVTVATIAAFALLLIIAIMPMPTANAADSSLTQYEWTMRNGDLQRTGYSDMNGPTTNYTVWKTDIGGAVYQSIIAADGKVFACTFGIPSNLIGLDAFSGKILWTVKLWANPTEVGRSSYDNGIVVSYAAAGRIIAVNANTGALIWEINTTTYKSYPITSFSSSWPIIINGTLYWSYTGNGQTVMAATDVATGKELWTVPIKGSFRGQPLYFDGKIEFPTDNGYIQCINLSTKQTLWTVQLPTTPTPLLAYGGSYAAGVVYHPVRDSTGLAHIGLFCAFNANDGTSVWNQTTTDLVVRSTAVSSKFSLFFGGSMDTYLYAIHWKTGGIVWKFKTDGAVGRSPVVAGNGIVYFGSTDNYIYAVDVKTGELVWKYEAGKVVTTHPALAYGNLYIGSDDYFVYCFGPAPASSLTVSTDKSSVDLGGKVTISGKMTLQNGTGISNEQLSIQYRNPPNTGNWVTIAQPTTSSDGTYSVQVIPPTVGQYQIATTYPGSNYLADPAASDFTVTFPTIDIKPITDSLNSLQSNITSLQSSIEGLKSTVDSNSQQTGTSSLQSSVSTLQSSVSTLQSSVSTLTTYLIALVALAVVAVVISAVSLVRKRK